MEDRSCGKLFVDPEAWAGQVDKTTSLKGIYYATLDFTPPTCSEVGTQDAFIEVPSGWEVAAFDKDIAKNVIAKFPWGTHVLVFADGQGYCTSAHEECGDMWSGDLLEWQGKACKPTTKSLRVLIRSKGPRSASAQYCIALNTKLWNEKSFSDCEVVCKDEVISCHRAVLAQASPVIAQMLSSTMAEAQQRRIVLNDTQPRAVKTILKYMYIGAITYDEVDDDLLRLADMYQVPFLFTFCLQGMLEVVNADNVVTFIRTFRGMYENPEVAEAYKKLVDKVRKDEALLQVVFKSV